MRRFETKALEDVEFTEEYDAECESCHSLEGALKEEELFPQGVLTNGNLIK